MAAATRPYWTGFLKLSLVTIVVRLYTATTEKERIHFHQIHEPSGERVRYQTVVPGLGAVERDEIVKGYEYQKGRYVTVEPADFEKLRLETTDTIDISQFVETDSVDWVYLDNPYYLVPDGSVAEEGYRVIREALRATEKVAIGQVVINARERIVAIRPYGKCLLVNALRFPDEVRTADQFLAGIGEGAVDEDELSLMEQIIARRTRKFEPEKFLDHYQAALKELIEEKLAGKLQPRPAEREPAQVINLMDALKRSLRQESKERAGTEARRAGKSARSVARDEASGKVRRGPPRSSKSQPSLVLPGIGGRARRSAAAPAEGPKRRRRA
jgi:DNA end-binding protein Ku